MKQLKIVFLISAKSGIGKGAKIHARLPAILDELGISRTDYRLQTIGAHDVALQAADPAKKAERLIVVGGDGITAAALAGVCASGEPVPVGVVPVGTGNDLARVTGMHRLLRKRGLKACVQQCLNAEAVPIDIWKINETHFMVNYLSIGMDAAVVKSFSRHREKRRTPYPSSFINFCMYGLFGVQQLFAGITGTTIMNVQGADSVETHRLNGLRELIVSNIPSYAAGTLVSPGTHYADRHLDITTFRTFFSFAGLFLVKPLRGMRKWYGTTLMQYQGNRVELHLAPGNALQIDGEDRTYLLDHTDTITIEHAGQGLVLTGEQ